MTAPRLLRARPIAGSVAVVIGATSGVGRATALSLAQRGALLVVVARDAHDVDELVSRCQAIGTEAVGVSADIGIAADVDRVITRALESFGRIDTWIDLAADLVVGDLTLQEVDDIERIVRTNVVGTALASRAIMTYFRSVDAGVMINVSSLLGVIPNPVVPTYVMTKFAIRGLTLSLDQSTWPRRRIRVCLVMPGPIDTPLFARSTNRSGRSIRAIPPAQSPERVAAAVMRSVERPRRQRTTGVTGALIVLGMHVVPRFTETVVAQVAARLIFRPNTDQHAMEAMSRVHGHTDGGWRRGRRRVIAGDGLGRYLARRGDTMPHDIGDAIRSSVTADRSPAQPVR